MKVRNLLWEDTIGKDISINDIENQIPKLSSECRPGHQKKLSSSDLHQASTYDESIQCACSTIIGCCESYVVEEIRGRVYAG